MSIINKTQHIYLFERVAMPNRYNQGYNRMFKQGEMSLGLFFPLESYSGDVPVMKGQEELAKLAESLNFAALWFRDVPLRDPTFGDVGQIYDPWVYLSWIAAMTSTITLATGSIVLPLRHPIHVAKAAASIDQLSGGRLVLGVASGDRPVEFSAFNVDIDSRGERFSDHFNELNTLLYDDFPQIENQYGTLYGNADLLPKAKRRIALLTTGSSRQDLKWIANNSDGWLGYPRSLSSQKNLINSWNVEVEKSTVNVFKPFSQSLYIDLSANPNEPARPIHLGFRCGREALIAFLHELQSIGVNHVALNLKYGSRPAKDVIQELGEYVVPHFGTT